MKQKNVTGNKSEEQLQKNQDLFNKLCSRLESLENLLYLRKHELENCLSYCQQEILPLEQHRQIVTKSLIKELYACYLTNTALAEEDKEKLKQSILFFIELVPIEERGKDEINSIFSSLEEKGHEKLAKEITLTSPEKPHLQGLEPAAVISPQIQEEALPVMEFYFRRIKQKLRKIVNTGSRRHSVQGKISPALEKSSKQLLHQLEENELQFKLEEEKKVRDNPMANDEERRAFFRNELAKPALAENNNLSLVIEKYSFFNYLLKKQINVVQSDLETIEERAIYKPLTRFLNGFEQKINLHILQSARNEMEDYNTKINEMLNDLKGPNALQEIRLLIGEQECLLKAE